MDKGGLSKSGRWYDPPLKLTGGAITVPTGPGLGRPAGSASGRRSSPVLQVLLVFAAAGEVHAVGAEGIL